MIEVKNLNKEFVKYEKESGLMGMIKSFFNAKKVIKHAVDDISFSIAEGEIVGYIGANGAGKSTTIKMLTGILTPTSGEVLIDGIIPYKNRKDNAYNIGVVFGQRTQLWWDLPLTESFLILKEIYDVSDEDFEKRMAFFNEILDINEFIKSPVRTLSLGQRMRADIVASLLHNPKVLYLDEPTIGLDVVAKQKMREAIKMMNKEYKTTVILTTHDIDDIEMLCDRIMIIDEGKVIYDGSLDEIKDRYGYMRTVKFDLQEPLDFDLHLNDEFNLETKDIHSRIEENSVYIEFNRKLVTVSKISQYFISRVNVTDMSITDAKIEYIVRRIYEKVSADL